MSGFKFGNAGGGTGTSGSSTGGLFGTSGGTPATSSMFGQPTPASSAPGTGGLFAGGASTGAKPLFGTGNTGTQPSLSFGSNGGSKPGSGASTPSLFGANNSTASASTSGIFGQPSSNTTSAGKTGGLFSTSSTGSALGGAAGGGGFNFAGGSAPAGDQSKPAGSQSGLFPSVGNTGSSLFGSATPTPSTAAPAGSTTPAGPKFSFTNSTTPAGPPPTAKANSKSLFGATPSGQQPLFGGAKPADSTQPKPSMFSNLGTGAQNSTPSSNLFGNPSSTPASSAATTASSAPASEAPKASFGFPPAASTPGSQAPAASVAPATTSLFGSATTSAAPASNLFGGTSKATTTTAPSSTATSAPASAPLFGNLGGTGGSGAPASSATSIPSTTAPASSNLFGQPAKSPATQPQSTAGMTAPGTTQPAGASQPLGSSISGPTPQQSRLKNKTMDEIITRWASDLLKYQKEFQEQAIKVASWDRLLVENGEKIQTLSDSTHEAERATREIESQLSAVESGQAELTSWIDRYEAEVDDMFARQVGPGESLQGPDQERERTYKIAEKLTDKVDEMGKNLTSMIEAINDASTNVSKNAKTDDPLSHIVRVLNSHLTQLQWIDQNTEVLQAKVASAQKTGQNISSNGYGGLDNDAAESFYRSYNNSRR
ncbi:Nucleoporin NSP1 [Hyphodiscus hymeniophilus]|uniref:Nucleoporin NSP1 n=1 Tax=Hyphodiscus hymeniophilus TaxID=353542 RepID=A0A9P6VMA1_9HELO|nr:Nucleoporin NSP1 [Hyphodiscus hymeniophilus]